MFAPFKSQANTYNRIQVETGVNGADPHQLVTMLLDGALSSLGAAINALSTGNIAVKCKAIARAVSIVEEGLRGALDMNAGGEVARTLDALYACVLVRLSRANVENNATMLHECIELLTPMRDAWVSIKPQKAAA